jgi:transposase
MLVRQRTMLINAIRGHCAEFGMIAPQGARTGRADLIEQVRDGGSGLFYPTLLDQPLLMLAEQLDALAVADPRPRATVCMVWHRQAEASQRLATIPGVGIITATALAASVTDPHPVPLRPGVCGVPWDWSRVRTPLAARIVSVGYRKWAMAI